jgi:hypothetical protein
VLAEEPDPFAPAETPAWVLERERQKRAQRQFDLQQEIEGLIARSRANAGGGGGGFQFTAP